MPLAPDQVQLVRSSGSLLLGPGTPYTVLPGWDPWSRTTRDPQSAERPYGHGSVVGAEWVNEAVVLIPVSVYRSGSTKAEWLAAHQQLAAAFTAVGSTGEMPELRFEWGGSEFVMFGRPRQVRVTADNISVGKSVQQCAFVAPDPRIYSGLLTTQATGLPVQQGGMTFPATAATTRLRLPGASGSYASTPNDVSFGITGDLDVRARISPRLWTGGGVQTIAAKFGTTSNQRSWQLVLQNDGLLRVNTSTDGINSSSRVATQAITSGGDVIVRFTLDVDNGAAGNTVTFYTGTSITGPWTQLGTPVVTAGVTSLFAGSEPLLVGASNGGATNPFRGVIRQVQVRSGITGTVVANPDFTVQVVKATSFTDSTGKLWTVNGSAAIVASTFRGGLTMPFTIPGVLTGGVLTLTNSGTSDTSLRARVDGPAIEPRLVLRRPDGTVQTLSFDLELADGQWLDIDTAARTALLNGLAGSNQRGVAAWDMDPHPIQPGVNSLRFASAVYNTTAQLTVEHRSAWW